MDASLDLDLTNFGMLLASIDRVEAAYTIERTNSGLVAAGAAFGGDTSVVETYLEHYYELIGLVSSAPLGINKLKADLGSGY